MVSWPQEADDDLSCPDRGKRQFVLPANVARAIGLMPGDRIHIDREGSQIVLKTGDDVIAAGQAAFRATIKHPFTVDDFIADRRAEAARD